MNGNDESSDNDKTHLVLDNESNAAVNADNTNATENSMMDSSIVSSHSKDNNDKTTATTTTGTMWNLSNKIKGFIIDNPNNDGDRANKWSYLIMVILMLFTVFSVMFGSYQYHARENVINSFTAVYDKDAKTWYTDPMNGRIMMMKQPKNKDIRVFESKIINPVTSEYSKPQLVNEIASYEWKNGMIANIHCSKKMVVIDNDQIECEEGTAVFNIYNTDESILDYVKQKQMQSDVNRQVITRIDR